MAGTTRKPSNEEGLESFDRRSLARLSGAEETMFLYEVSMIIAKHKSIYEEDLERLGKSVDAHVAILEDNVRFLNSEIKALAHENAQLRARVPEEEERASPERKSYSRRMSTVSERAEERGLDSINPNLIRRVKRDVWLGDLREIAKRRKALDLHKEDTTQLSKVFKKLLDQWIQRYTRGEEIDIMLSVVLKFEEAMNAEEQRELARGVKMDRLFNQLKEKEEEIEALEKTKAAHRELLYAFEYRLRETQHKSIEQAILIDQHEDQVADLKVTAKAEKEEIRRELLTSLKVTMDAKEKAIRKELEPYCHLASDILNYKRESAKPEFLRDDHILDLGIDAAQGGTCLADLYRIGSNPSQDESTWFESSYGVSIDNADKLRGSSAFTKLANMHFDMQHYQWTSIFPSSEHEKIFQKLKRKVDKVEKPKADAEDGTPGSLNKLLLEGRNGKSFKALCTEHDAVSRIHKQIRQDEWVSIKHSGSMTPGMRSSEHYTISERTRKWRSKNILRGFAEYLKWYI
ncbi:hypothetical protein ACMFMF_003739 [Clarireedia jacksonii]